MGPEGGQGRVGVVAVPEERVRVDGCRVGHRDAAQTVVRGPDEAGVRTHEGGQGRGVGDGVEERVGAEVGAGRLDGEAELGDEDLVVGGPLGTGDDARHPDPVPGELSEGHRPGVRQRVGGAGEELERLVEDPDGLDVLGEGPTGRGDGAERGVDLTGPDGGDGRLDVEQHEHVEVDLGVRVVEAAHQARRGAARGDDVDAQWAAAGVHGRDRAFGDAQQFAGVGQERLPVDGELGAARGAGEQPDTEGALQRGDAFGDGLLGDPQLGGCLLKLPRVGGGDEGPDGVEIHADTLRPQPRVVADGHAVV